MNRSIDPHAFRRRLKLRTLLILGASLATATAQAGLPLLAEDASVLAPRDCEFEAGALSESTGDASALEQVLNLSCGVGFGSQLGLAVGRLKDADMRTGQRALGGKVSLWQGEDGAGAALAAAAVWEHSDGRWRQSALSLIAAYSRPLPSDVTLHLNLGHRQDRVDSEASTTWAAALEHEGFALGALTLAPMAELFGSDRSAPWWNAGLRLTLLPEQLWLGLSYGRQINPERARLATASLKLAF
jgi:hypothetical protein